MPDSGILTAASIFIIGREEVVRFDGAVQALLSLKANSVLNGSINPLNTLCEWHFADPMRWGAD